MSKESILRLLSNKTFEADKNWAIDFLSNVLIEQSMGADKSYYEDKIAKSKEVVLVGSDNSTSMYDKGDEVEPGSIAVIKMSGVMMTESGWCHRGVTSIAKDFREMYANDNVIGILFDVNSGGGESVAGDVINSVISERNKPVVTHAKFLGSAAVKGTCDCDEIIAISDTTVIGSIGVMLSLNKKAIKRYNKEVQDIYSKKSDGKNKEFRALLSNEDISLFVEKITQMDEKFMDKIKRSRPLKGDEEYIAKTLDGSTFLAEEAKNRGLIDSIGSYQHALSRIKSHSNYY